MGEKDNRGLEARRDVLVYTSPVLADDVEIIGPVTAELYVTSSLEYTDFFPRLCVVARSARSTNLCDGILRLCPGQPPSERDGTRKVRIDLWPTAYHFRKGGPLRPQLSPPPHPPLPRNF